MLNFLLFLLIVQKYEVYLGGIRLDVLEGDIKKFPKSIEEIIEVWMMRGKDASKNKGYDFVSFRTKELLTSYIWFLLLSHVKRVRCLTPQEKHKLFIGNVSKSLTLENMEKVVRKVRPWIIHVELLKL